MSISNAEDEEETAELLKRLLEECVEDKDDLK